MDAETSPFQVNPDYQVPRDKPADYVGKAALEAQRAEIEAGRYPFALKLVGLKMGGRPITDYAPDFWLVTDEADARCGYVTSPWFSPELDQNIALAFVPWGKSATGTRLRVELPEMYQESSGKSVPAIVSELPFVASAHPSARERAGSERGIGSGATPA